jgi:hypothetical protein
MVPAALWVDLTFEFGDGGVGWSDNKTSDIFAFKKAKYVFILDITDHG